MAMVAAMFAAAVAVAVGSAWVGVRPELRVVASAVVALVVARNWVREGDESV